MFPLAGSQLSPQLRDAPEVLTRAVAKALHASVAKVTIEQAAKARGCELEADACLEAVTWSMSAKRIVFGSVTGRADDSPGATVRLTWFDGSGDLEHRFVLDGETSAALADQLVREVQRVADKRRRYSSEPGAVSVFEPEPAQDTPPARVATTSSNATSYALIGGGAAIALVGAGFFVSAHGLRDDVRRAPTSTTQDFEHLAALERAGRTRMMVGDALVIGGGALAIVGALRLYLQHDEVRPERPGFRVQPEAGGVSLVFGGRWR